MINHNKQKRAIVLCGINAHIMLINNLKRRGYQVVLIDLNDQCPAYKYANEYIKADAFDKEIVYKIAIKWKADLVISVAADTANIVASYVSELIGVPFLYSYNTAKTIGNKLEVKKILLKHNIPTAQSYDYIELSKDNIVDLLPLVVKPIDSYGSKGVRVVFKIDEFDKFYYLAKKASKTKNVIIEKFIEGKEINGYFQVIDGICLPVLFSDKFKLDINGNTVMQSVGTVSPSTIKSNIKEKLSIIAQKICKLFELKNTTLLVQYLIDSKNEPHVIEFMPRLGGGMSYKIVKLATGFDMIDAMIDSIMHIPVKVELINNKNLYAVLNIYADECILGDVEGVEQLLSENICNEIFINKKSGTYISPDKTSSDRVGQLYFISNGKADLINRINKIIDIIKIYSIENIQVFDKRIYNPLIQIGDTNNENLEN